MSKSRLATTGDDIDGDLEKQVKSQRARKFKKVQAKKLAKSNKSIS